MLGTMHLIMSTPCPVTVRNLLKKAHIPFTPGRHINQSQESSFVVQVPITDFAQMARVISLCGDEINSKVGIVDARGRFYWYFSVTRELIRHGELFPAHCDDRQPCSFMFAGINYRYLEGGF